MAVDLQRVVEAAARAALDDGSSGQGQQQPARRRGLSAPRALLIGAGLFTAGRLITSARGRELLGGLQDRVEGLQDRVEGLQDRVADFGERRTRAPGEPDDEDEYDDEPEDEYEDEEPEGEYDEDDEPEDEYDEDEEPEDEYDEDEEPEDEYDEDDEPEDEYAEDDEPEDEEDAPRRARTASGSGGRRASR